MSNLLHKTHVRNGLSRSKTFTLNQISELATAIAQDVAVLASAIEDIGNGGASYDDFTGAGLSTAGLSGLVPAPSIGDADKFLRGDGEWASVSGGTSEVMTGATNVAGKSGLVPAPQVGDNNKFLCGNGNWVEISDSSSSGVDYVIGSNVSTVEGGLWRDVIDATPVLKLRHGDYEYNFNYDSLTFLGGESIAIANVEPDTYVIGTDSVSAEGGLWYELSDNTPTLNLHAGSFNYGFNYDSITYKGGNSHLVSYLPFDISTTADACGNEWTAFGSPTIQNNALYLNGSADSLKMTRQIGGQDFTIDFWFSLSSESDWSTVFSMYNFTATNGVNQLYFVLLKTEVRYIESTKQGLAPDNVQIGQRCHGALVYRHEEKQLLVFLDGVLFFTSPIEISQSQSDFYIGCVVGGNYLNGYVDNFRIFDGQALWTENFTPPTAADYA